MSGSGLGLGFKSGSLLTDWVDCMSGRLYVLSTVFLGYCMLGRLCAGSTVRWVDFMSGRQYVESTVCQDHCIPGRLFVGRPCFRSVCQINCMSDRLMSG